MITPPLSQAIQRIAQVENTPELRNYWERRFTGLFEKEVFELHHKTAHLLEQGATIDSPFTPFGLLNIHKVITQAGDIDEVELQNTIDASVRLLDNILDIIEGEEQSISVMKDFRKIALGIINFEDFILSSDNKTLRIDTLGNLVSNGAYRSSESLAEEKGTCRAWDSIKYMLRPKTFEYWYHVDNGKIIDAHSLSDDYDQESVIRSGYEIIPRRNSHLLSYPHDKEWAIWTDRDVNYDSHQQQEHDENEVENPEKNQEKNSEQHEIQQIGEQPITTDEVTDPNTNNVTDQNADQANSNQQSSSNSKDNVHAVENTTVGQGDSKDSSSKSGSIFTLNLGQNHLLLNPDTTLEDQLIPIDANTNDDNSDNKGNGGNYAQEIEDHKTLQFLENNHAAEQEEATDTMKIVIDRDEDTENSGFQIGELVIISDKNSAFFHVTAQIVDQTEIEGNTLYTLRSNDDAINNARWRENQLTSVDLFDLLDRVNITSDEDTADVTLQTLILNDKQQVLVISGKESRNLPEFKLPYNAIPEQILPRLFKETYGSSIKLIREIGSAVEFASRAHKYKVILAFQCEIDPTDIPAESEWRSFREVQFSLSPSSRVICNKFNRFHMNTQPNASHPSYSSHNDRNQNQHNSKEQNASETSEVESKNDTSMNQNNNHTNSILDNQHPTMSQYILKLENIVQSEIFGNVTVNFRFDNNKPYLMSITGDNLSDDLMYFADIVIHFANHLLTLDQQPVEVADFLAKVSQNQQQIKMNDLLILLADSLKNVPAKPDQLSQVAFQ